MQVEPPRQKKLRKVPFPAEAENCTRFVPSSSPHKIFDFAGALSVRPCHQIDWIGNDDMAGRQRQIYNEERFA